VHKSQCANLKHLATRDGARVLPCEWLVPEGAMHPAKLEVVVSDRVGMLHSLTQVLSEIGVNIADISLSAREGSRAIVFLTLEVTSAQQLAAVIVRMEALADVISVRRVSSR